MAKKRKFNDGGQFDGPEIVAKGRVNIDPTFNLSRLGREGGAGGDMGGGLGGGMGGGAPSQRMMPLGKPPMPEQSRMAMTPAVLRQQPSPVGKLAGDRGATGYGGSFRMGFAEGGKAKAKPVKKMAKGGSVSKRADGCCSKGKTKGKMV